MPWVIKGKTLHNLIEELAHKEEKNNEATEEDPLAEELINLIVEKGLVAGTIEWVRRHPDKLEEALTDLEERMKREGYTNDEIERTKIIIRATVASYME